MIAEIKTTISATCIEVKNNDFGIKLPMGTNLTKLQKDLDNINELFEAITEGSGFEYKEIIPDLLEEVEFLHEKYPGVLFAVQPRNWLMEKTNRITTYHDILADSMIAGFIKTFPAADFAKITFEDHDDISHNFFDRREFQILRILFYGRSNVCIFTGEGTLCSCGCYDPVIHSYYGEGNGIGFRDYKKFIEIIRKQSKS